MARLDSVADASPDWGRARLQLAHQYRDQAKQLIDLNDTGSGNPAMSLCVSAAIAYVDAVTAVVGLKRSTGEHASALKLLRDVMRNKLEDKVGKAFNKLLNQKSEVQYGVKSFQFNDAAEAHALVVTIGEWAEGILAAT
ncbi:MAG: hypothetical protein OJJ21_22290 [Ferrovibrio sp.]|uniref:hypothetical protein n=1 Tax=Ferrovibrio sp. TaxID=1917215 RepID=UPI00261899D7|nr:hypothetical protein [Ferrovibrio sp.]MCW0236344.1 hypothetical protein [Ferrovibrio sp.]